MEIPSVYALVVQYVQNYGMNNFRSSAVTKTSYAEAQAFVTKDGSVIRELMHPARHAAAAQSFAEAIVAVGETTERHLHQRSEEIYHITSGEGLMMLGEEKFSVGLGDTVVIAPGTPHCIRNTGSGPLKFICASAPAYSHEDTVLL
jgi:mannose-6-phosphate isomerase-like protein (cupin superfamily)